MNDVSSVPIGDYENTLSFPSEETSLGRRGFPHISLREIYHARLEPFSRFSPPHIGTLNTQCDSCHHGFEDTVR
jgi:hypothetical protein